MGAVTAQEHTPRSIIGVINLRGKTMKMTKAQKKVGKVMGEYKAGTLHSGKGGKVVKNPKQAIAIALSSAKVPMKKGKM